MTSHFMNTTDSVGLAIIAFTQNVTGSLFATLLIILVCLFLVCLVFRMPVELSGIVLLPLLIYLAAITDQFLALFGVLLIYLAVIFSKHFFLK